MPTDKLVDGDFLAKLVSGSYEVAMGAVEEAVRDNAAEAFGDSEARTIATFHDHFIVATPGGEFYRGEWSIDEESGSVVLSEIASIEVPVYEASAMGSEIRREAAQTVDLLLHREDEQATEKLRHLFNLVSSGARLTAEGVEDLYTKQEWSKADWFQAIQENDENVRKFLGNDAIRLSVPKPRFESITGDVPDEEAERYRMSVVGGLKKLGEHLQDMQAKLALATEVHEGYSLRGSDEDGAPMAVADYVEFVSDFTEDLDGMMGILDDALAVADDGCVPCLARVHDGIAENMYEWALAAAFAEKLARRFEAPQAA